NGVFSYNGMLYRGHLMIRKDADNLLLPINKLLMEDYLKGVVPAEIGKLKKNMIEASKAQAVAARTYAFAHLRKHEDMGYDLECTVQDQVYRGYLLEDSLTNEAIESTKGIVAYYKNSPIDAKYHSTCGGHTSSNEDEWGGPPAPYLRGRFDGEGCLFKRVYCSQSKHYKWSYEYDRDDFYEMVSGNYSLMKKVNVKAANIFVSKQDKYKRIVELTIEDSSGKKYKVRGLDIRRLFTFEEHLGGMLKSRNFTLDHKKGKIIINGGGFGHGVGMCQYGAMEMAKSGKNYKQILNHYYKGIQLKRIY
ncbi:MAG: SpoIID/LytB domain-containing protein, partial [bacterium]|nr:SpoIID/LytB domain-containing protein [bacterium]